MESDDHISIITVKLGREQKPIIKTCGSGKFTRKINHEELTNQGSKMQELMKNNEKVALGDQDECQGDRKNSTCIPENDYRDV